MTESYTFDPALERKRFGMFVSVDDAQKIWADVGAGTISQAESFQAYRNYLLKKGEISKSKLHTMCNDRSKIEPVGMQPRLLIEHKSEIECRSSIKRFARREAGGRRTSLFRPTATARSAGKRAGISQFVWLRAWK